MNRTEGEWNQHLSNYCVRTGVIGRLTEKCLELTEGRVDMKLDAVKQGLHKNISKCK